jgi:hypothetical protein
MPSENIILWNEINEEPRVGFSELVEGTPSKEW